MDTPIYPNDVAVILRPDYKEGTDWNGGFEIIIAGFGPVTMPEDSMRDLVGMAMLIATTVPMMEKDEKLTEQVMTACAEYYGDPDNVMVDSDDVADDGFVLSADTKTVGDMQ